MGCGCNPNDNKCGGGCQDAKQDKRNLWIWLILFVVFIAASWLAAWLFAPGGA